MKKTILQTAAVLLILAGMTVSCGKEEKPIEIPFTEYSLTETFWQWSNLGYDGKVIVINSNAELENYITCTEGTFPEIDFSNNTLLIACGASTWNVGSINTIILKHSTTEYELKVTIFMGNATVVERWHIAIIIPKISRITEINLRTDYVQLNF
ncbi:MAG: hypothetical protein LBE11_02865 [Prevotellaceae bacterium]|jgi:hypothetical protein|nr:hypothetical protein [Prevotellaceae bacterium]